MPNTDPSPSSLEPSGPSQQTTRRSTFAPPLIDGEPWFVGADVLTFLYGISNGRANAYNCFEETQLTKVKRIHLGPHSGKDMIIVTTNRVRGGASMLIVRKLG